MISSASTLLIATLVFNAASVIGAPVRIPEAIVARAEPAIAPRSLVFKREESFAGTVEARDVAPAPILTPREDEQVDHRFPRRHLHEFYKREPKTTIKETTVVIKETVHDNASPQDNGGIVVSVSQTVSTVVEPTATVSANGDATPSDAAATPTPTPDAGNPAQSGNQTPAPSATGSSLGGGSTPTPTEPPSSSPVPTEPAGGVPTPSTPAGGAPTPSPTESATDPAAPTSTVDTSSSSSSGSEPTPSVDANSSSCAPTPTPTDGSGAAQPSPTDGTTKNGGNRSSNPPSTGCNDPVPTPTETATTEPTQTPGVQDPNNNGGGAGGGSENNATNGNDTPPPSKRSTSSDSEPIFARELAYSGALWASAFRRSLSNR